VLLLLPPLLLLLLMLLLSLPFIPAAAAACVGSLGAAEDDGIFPSTAVLPFAVAEGSAAARGAVLEVSGGGSVKDGSMLLTRAT
jgi:hypothetical protein